MQQSTTEHFSAPIRKVGINPCVDVPRRVSDAFGARGYIPVAGSVNGVPIRSTLVPKGGGLHRLFLNGAIRKAAGIDVGDIAEIELEYDEAPREIAPPEDLAEALLAAGLTDPFDALTTARRTEMLAWLLDAKRPDTRARRVARIVEFVGERKSRRG